MFRGVLRGGRYVEERPGGWCVAVGRCGQSRYGASYEITVSLGGHCSAVSFCSGTKLSLL